VSITEEEKEMLEKLRVKVEGFSSVLSSGREQLIVRRNEMKMSLESNAEEFTASVDTLKLDFTTSAPYTGPNSTTSEVVNSTIQSAITLLSSFQQRITHGRQTYAFLTNGVKVFESDKIGGNHAASAAATPQQLPSSSLTPTELDSVESELQLLERVWQMYQQWQQSYDTWQQTYFHTLDIKAIEQTVNSTQKLLNKLTRQCKQWSVTQCLIQAVTTFRQLLPLFTNLRSPAFKERHWQELSNSIKQLTQNNTSDTIFDTQDEFEFTLSYILSYNISQYTDTINSLTVHAEREYTIEQHLQQIEEQWNSMIFTLIPYIKNNNPSNFSLFTKFDILNDQLEHDTLLLSGIKHSPSYHVFATVVDHWQGILMNVSEVLELLSSVQTNWKYLETIFLDSVEISKQLPNEVEKFLAVHQQWLQVVQAVQTDLHLLQHLPPHSSLIDTLQHQMEQLERIQHSLDQFLQQKRIIYPRFYFLSNENLLELLGAARDLTVINKHIHKFFAGIQTLDYIPGQGEEKPTVVTAIRGKDNEVFTILKPIVVEGDVEQWLVNVDIQMVDTLEKILQTSLLSVTKVGGYHRCTPQQLLPLINTMLGSMLILSGQIIWTSKITSSLMDLGSGKNLKSLKKLKLDWYEYITRLSTLLRTSDLSALDRSKVNNQMVVEVHARDVLNKLRAMQKINRLHSNSFEWMSQLRFYYDKTSTVRSHHSSNPHLERRHDYGLCYIQQTNTQFDYGYEYVGNIGRLVITPLTDRCYMTLTTALSLYRGGSPLGPAGTGRSKLLEPNNDMPYYITTLLT